MNFRYSVSAISHPLLSFPSGFRLHGVMGPAMFIALLGLLERPCAGQELRWSDPMRLDTDAADSWGDYAPAVALSEGGTAVCVWVREACNPSCSKALMAARSSDAGRTWSTPVVLMSWNQGNGDLFWTEPDIATGGDGIWIITWNSGNGGVPRFEAFRSIDDGQNWSAIAIDVVGPGNDYYSNRPRIGMSDSGTCLISARNTFTGEYRISRSTDFGATWTVLPYLTGVGEEYFIKPVAEGVWLWAWSSGNSFVLARSTDDGLTWPDRRTFNQPGTEKNHWPSLDQAVDGDCMLTWRAWNGGVLYRTGWSLSEDQGVTWSTPIELTTGLASDAAEDHYPQAFSKGGNAWGVAWRGALAGLGTGTDPDIFTISTTNAGTSWRNLGAMNASFFVDTAGDGRFDVESNAAGQYIVMWERQLISGHHEVLCSYATLTPLRQDYEYDQAGRLVAARFTNGRRIFYTHEPTHDRSRKIVTSQVVVEEGPSSSLGHTIASDQSGVVPIQIRLACNEEEDLRLTAIRLGGAGSIDESTDITSVRLYRDADSSGSVTPADALLASSAFPSDDGAAGLLLASPLPLAAGSATDLLIACDLSGSAAVGETLAMTVGEDDQVSIETMDGQSILPVGAPIEGAAHAISATPDTTPPAFAGLDPIPAGGVVAHLGWAAATDVSQPITYHVYQSQDPGFVPTGSPKAVVTGATSLDIPGLDLDEDHFFIVRAQDGAGNIDANMVRRSFRPTDQTAPVFAGLTSAAFDPASTGTITLDWPVATDESSPVLYDVWYSSVLDPDPESAAPIASTPGNHLTLPGHQGGVLHRFIVRSRDPQGNHDTNLVYRRVSSPSPPLLPEDPPSGTLDLEPPVALSMQPAIDPDGGIAYYFFEVWREEIGPDGEILQADYRGDFVAPPPVAGDRPTFAPADYFQRGQIYKWRVQAWDTALLPSTFSDVFTFGVAGEPTTGIKEWMLIDELDRRPTP